MMGLHSTSIQSDNKSPILGHSTIQPITEVIPLPSTRKKNKKKRSKKKKNRPIDIETASHSTNLSDSVKSKILNNNTAVLPQTIEATPINPKKRKKGKKSKKLNTAQDIQIPSSQILKYSINGKNPNCIKVLNESDTSKMNVQDSTSFAPEINSGEQKSSNNNQKRKRETETETEKIPNIESSNSRENIETSMTKVEVSPLTEEIIMISDSSDEEIETTNNPSDNVSPDSEFNIDEYEEHIVCGSLDNMPKKLNKYWHQRYNLFSRYDEGCVLDTEGWYSVTPERVAKRIAERLACKTIVDGFCGVGGNAIQFALTCEHVIAVDNNPIRLAFAKQNAKIYGVDKKIEFILGDFFEIAPTLKVDGVFLSPPWGGPAYNKVRNFNIKTMMPFSGVDLFDVCAKITNKIAYFLPRNTDYEQLGELAAKFGPCEIEEQYSNDHFIAITAFYEKFNTAA